MVTPYQPEMAEFFNFDQAAIPETSPNVVMQDASETNNTNQGGTCPSHPYSEYVKSP